MQMPVTTVTFQNIEDVVLEHHVIYGGPNVTGLAVVDLEDQGVTRFLKDWTRRNLLAKDITVPKPFMDNHITVSLITGRVENNSSTCIFCRL